MKVRKIICMLLALTLLFSCNVYGDEQETTIGEAYQEDTLENIPGDIQPMYTNINMISSELAITTSGTAICTGLYVMVKNLKSEIVLTLQRRPKSGSSIFSTYKEWSASNTGKGSFVMEKKPTVTKGYDYRLRVVVKIYSGSTVTEAAACYSATITY